MRESKKTEKYYAFEETKGKVIGSVHAETWENAEKMVINKYNEYGDFMKAMTNGECSTNVTAMSAEDLEEMECEK